VMGITVFGDKYGGFLCFVGIDGVQDGIWTGYVVEGRRRIYTLLIFSLLVCISLHWSEYVGHGSLD
jgi:hypothetical protein